MTKNFCTTTPAASGDYGLTKINAEEESGALEETLKAFSRLYNPALLKLFYPCRYLTSNFLRGVREALAALYPGGFNFAACAATLRAFDDFDSVLCIHDVHPVCSQGFLYPASKLAPLPAWIETI